MDTSPTEVLNPLQRRKRAAILAGAEEVFLDRGYASTTMDDVAAAAGVGKQTVYRHFASKEALFESLIASMCVDGALAGRLEDGAERSTAARLRDLGWALLHNLMSDNGIRLYRAVVAEAQRRPELGRLFYENGAKLVRSLAADILSTVYDDQTAALRASTYISLVLGDAHLELTLGYRITDRRARFAEQIEEAVSAALR
ncbi:TetR/AcrR family transcriptional regulator [Mycolicibacterium sp. P1-18]|uniref:TetR/AcrR family transcriptional regulator n=1 Tax=Mycolicibacterium sp. P1-18 TaxID=2024615 RepID=UPI0011F2B7A4|nr:TetR/AcrR family transcriptional regulator [Mycolicibacterium sp. P1-18]KAA0092762.1 TetR/AcrR family transcriptional regulator [Mycolicibacterium sp. P1-18]